MSAAYDLAAHLLGRAESAAPETTPEDYALTLATIGTGRAVLAAAEELEALVELLRERLPERPEPRVEHVHVNLDGVEPSAMASALAAATARARGRSGSDPTAVDLVDDPGCAYYLDGVGVDRCGIPLSEHGAVREHEWIRP